MFRVVGTFRDGTAYRFQRPFRKRATALKIFDWHLKSWSGLMRVKEVCLVCTSSGRTIKRRVIPVVMYLGLKPTLFQKIYTGIVSGERVIELLRANMSKDTVETLDKVSADDNASVCLVSVECPECEKLSDNPGMFCTAHTGLPKFLDERHLGPGKKIHLF